MAVVTYAGVEYSCVTALKGADYIHLLNAEGKLTVAFDGITDFTGFSISDGSWITPVSDDNCHIAVVREDGAIGKGSHRCSDIASKVDKVTGASEGSIPTFDGNGNLAVSECTPVKMVLNGTTLEITTLK